MALLLTFLAFPVAEIAIFVAVAAAIGFLPALALALLTSLMGLIILRRVGRTRTIRVRLDGIEGVAREAELTGDDFWLIPSGILLLIPGFLSDLMGLLMLVPWVRRRLSATIGRVAERAEKRRRRGAQVVDLAPGEWRPVPEERITRQERE